MQGLVVLNDDGFVTLVPAVPVGIAELRTDCAVNIRGSNVPPLGQNVSAEGELSGHDLHISSWSPLGQIPADWNESAYQKGVAANVAHAVRDAVPRDWGIISTGAAKTRDGGRMSAVFIVRTRPAVFDWMRRQPKNAILIYAFIRQAGEPSVIFSGDG